MISKTQWPSAIAHSDSYYSLVASTGVEVFDSEDDDDYQGDSFALVRDGDRWGWLTFGWGSCSGCDALQAAEGDEEELSELREQLIVSIVWRDSVAEVIAYATDADAVRHWSDSETARSLVKRISYEVQP